MYASLYVPIFAQANLLRDIDIVGICNNSELY